MTLQPPGDHHTAWHAVTAFLAEKSISPLTLAVSEVNAPYSLSERRKSVILNIQMGVWDSKYIQGAAKNTPLQKLQYLKRRDIFVRNFQRLLGRKFATKETTSMQYHASLRKWCDFWFQRVIFH